MSTLPVVEEHTGWPRTKVLTCGFVAVTVRLIVATGPDPPVVVKAYVWLSCWWLQANGTSTVPDVPWYVS
jgi:hypothetical protein